ncbi:MAG: 50S ribosomal protein L24 [Phycisphaerae bacterium]|nr:50S ribosomal protein L24 [Phycisphaerae bacterium]
MARHIRQGDLVMVTAGNDRGSTGKILKVLTKENRVLVEGINIRKRHVKPSQANPQGGRIEKEMPIHISNVSPVSPSTGKPTRVRFETRPDGSKVRVAIRGDDVLSTLKKARPGKTK